MSASTTAPTAGKDEVKPGLLHQIAESNGLMGAPKIGRASCRERV